MKVETNPLEVELPSLALPLTIKIFGKTLKRQILQSENHWK